MKSFILSVYLLLLASCASAPAPPASEGKAMPERTDKGSASQVMKTDFNRMADVELSENMTSLRTLMLKLYKRNPKELAKSTADHADKMVEWVFDGATQHHWQFEEIENKQGTEALYLTFNQDFKGDRVLAFIVGLSTMLQKAHGGKDNFYLTDDIHPQSLYNVARNIEIAAWKLSTSRKPDGELYLLSNELNDHERNLSFEREFGKMVGRTDLLALMLAEKSQRLISRIMQSIATAPFLPF
jgi:hypothetical protein